MQHVWMNIRENTEPDNIRYEDTDCANKDIPKLFKSFIISQN